MGDFWRFLTSFGDAATLIPSTLLMILALAAAPASRRRALEWLALLASIAVSVAISKLLFLAWGVGVASLDFIGLSGHSAMSAAVWPALFGLLAGHCGRLWRIVGIILGFALAFAIAVSRFELHAHSISEVVSGFVAGALPTLLFLNLQGENWRLHRQRYRVIFLFAVTIMLMHGVRFPSQLMLRDAAKYLSTDSTIHTRRPVKP